MEIKNKWLYLHPDSKPTGRIPGYDMRIKIDDNLKKVAAAINMAPLDHAIFADLLCKKLIASDLLADIPGNNGLTMIQATGKSRVFDVVSVLVEYLGIPAMDMETFDAFCKCIVIDDEDAANAAKQ